MQIQLRLEFSVFKDYEFLGLVIDISSDKLTFCLCTLL